MKLRRLQVAETGAGPSPKGDVPGLGYPIDVDVSATKSAPSTGSFKYVRESGCQPSKTLVSSRFARDVGALAMDDDVDVLRMEDVGYASQDEVQDEALVLNTGGAAPKKLQRGARGARDRGESDGAQVGPRAPGASVATLAVVGVVTLVVLAAAAIASIASRTARHKTPVDVVGLVPVVGGSSGSAEALAHVVEGSEKMKHL
ncbi:hypothetical protein ONE63_002199 [Megalurothrips usitatus]|uniref:Uncharacterized protein n=1 Tax=Megalurothrips usitatus TaxID=439358 RepID=A0AAV7XAD4_9NEOP|nr:hypothetical protein ONE63_002199 [Megalurothrips usitatus]